VLVDRAVSLHHPHIDVGALYNVTETSGGLENFVKVTKQSNKNVPVLGMVEDIALKDFTVLLVRLREGHFLDIEKQFLVGLDSIMESAGD